MSVPRGTPAPRPRSLGEVAQGAAEDALTLLAAQIKLARLELSADLRRGLQGGVRIALFLPPLVIGYAFAMTALASWLGRYWGRPAALASVAALQIVPAVLGIARALAALRQKPEPARSGGEIPARFPPSLAAVSQAPKTVEDCR